MTRKTKKTPTPIPSNKVPRKAKAKKAPSGASTKSSAATKRKKLSAIAGAARVLDETGRAMTCPELIDVMAAKGYWKSPGGKTPAATLHAAITREIKFRGADARFRKTERGKFAATGVA